MIDKVEVGKKYRLIDKEGYLSYDHNSVYNANVLGGCFDENLCVVVDEVNHNGWGMISGEYVISRGEFRFFELVEEDAQDEEPKVITPETQVTITTTYGELARVYYILGFSNGMSHGTCLWNLAASLLGDKDLTIYDAHRPEIGRIDYNSVQKKWESLFFKSKEQQEKELAIKQKQSMIAQLQKEIQELGGA